MHEYSISENGYCELCDIMLLRNRHFAHSETNWHMVNLKLKQLNLVDVENNKNNNNNYKTLILCEKIDHGTILL